MSHPIPHITTIAFNTTIMASRAIIRPSASALRAACSAAPVAAPARKLHTTPACPAISAPSRSAKMFEFDVKAVGAEMRKRGIISAAGARDGGMDRVSDVALTARPRLRC